MKRLLILLIIINACVVSGLSQYKESDNFDTSAPNKPFVDKQQILLELFTSESCAACPPAEEMLMKLEKDQPFQEAELITLEFHVDYRDGFGRKDIYASPLFTQRQQVYDRKFRTGQIYTPQMVVDGNIEFIGTKMDKAENAVRKTLKQSKGVVSLSVKDERLRIKVSDLPKHGFTTLYLAIAEGDITTRNRKDEKAKNVSIVRRLNALRRIKPEENNFETETAFQLDSGWKKENLKLVVFVQENTSRKIFGVNQIKVKQ
jgi:hypothetical protein